MKLIYRLFSLLLILASLASCASIVSDSRYKVTLDSERKSEFKVKNKYDVTIQSGVTPQVVNLNSGSGYFKKAEYKIEYHDKYGEIKSKTIVAKLDNWYWGNILFGGLIGMLIFDPISGAMYELPERVELK